MREAGTAEIDTEAGAGDDRADVVVTGVGSASPRAAAALSQALGLPVETVVDAIYRAPARLVGALPRADAERLAGIVAGLGLEVAALPAAEVPPRAAPIDVAAELLDPGAADAVADALGRFLGMTPADALATLLVPPGIVLGNVSPATLQALAARLPAGAVRLTGSEPLTARYALFACGLSAREADLVRPHLPEGGAIGPDGTATLFDIDRATADALWRRLRAPDRLRIVNQDFLRFGIDLVAAPADAGPAAARLADVPAEDFPLLRAALPCRVESGVGYAAVADRLAAWRAAGCEARAELETFAAVALDVLAADADALAVAGLAGPAPLRTPPMPLAQARLLRHRLESLGADVLEAAA